MVKLHEGLSAFVLFIKLQGIVDVPVQGDRSENPDFQLLICFNLKLANLK